MKKSPFYMPKSPIKYNENYPVTYVIPVPELTNAEKMHQMISEKYQLEGAD